MDDPGGFIVASVLIASGATWLILLVHGLTVSLTTRRDADKVRVEMASARATRQNVLVLLVSFALVVSATPSIGVLTTWIATGILGGEQWAWLALELVTLALATATIVAVSRIRAKFENDHTDFSTVLRDLRDDHALGVPEGRVASWRAVIDATALRQGLPKDVVAKVRLGSVHRLGPLLGVDETPADAVRRLHPVRRRPIRDEIGRWDRAVVVALPVTTFVAAMSLSWLLEGWSMWRVASAHALVFGTFVLSLLVSVRYARARGFMISVVRVQQDALRRSCEDLLTNVLLVPRSADLREEQGLVSVDELRAALEDLRRDLREDARRQQGVPGPLGWMRATVRDLSERRVTRSHGGCRSGSSADG